MFLGKFTCFNPAQKFIEPSVRDVLAACDVDRAEPSLFPQRLKTKGFKRLKKAAPLNNPIILKTMNNFTPEAELLWREIPEQPQDRILAHVFCVKCGKGVQIQTFKREDRRSDTDRKVRGVRS